MEPLQNTQLFCPYCGERNEIVIDTSVGDQEYFEDCQVCCKPIRLCISISDDQTMEVVALGQDDA